MNLQRSLSFLAAPLAGAALFLALSTEAQVARAADALSDADACLGTCDKRFERCEKRAKDHREAGECAFERQECRTSCGVKDKSPKK
jgi:hypothetical protein